MFPLIAIFTTCYTVIVGHQLEKQRWEEHISTVYKLVNFDRLLFNRRFKEIKYLFSLILLKSYPWAISPGHGLCISKLRCYRVWHSPGRICPIWWYLLNRAGVCSRLCLSPGERYFSFFLLQLNIYFPSSLGISLKKKKRFFSIFGNE